jgi:polyisoprenoid-binding protein YceI
MRRALTASLKSCAIPGSALPTSRYSVFRALLYPFLLSLLAVLYTPHSVATDVGKTDMQKEWRSIAALSQLNYWVGFQSVPIKGEFRKFSVRYKPGDTLLVSVDIRSAEMGDSELNSEIAAADWFDSKHFAEARFVSNSIASINDTDNQFLASGTLQLKGISRTIAVPFSWQPDGHITGELVIPRTDFAIGSGQWSSSDQIGIDVRVSFDVRLQSDAAE